jgi:hypothetical protein
MLLHLSHRQVHKEALFHKPRFGLAESKPVLAETSS